MARTLLTIGISHYCEKARWALDRAGMAYEEEAYAPGAHVWPVRRAGGRSTPVLRDGDHRIVDSTDVLEHVAATPGAAFAPWGPPAVADQVRALEARFDDDLGPHLRRLVYFHLLPDRAATLAVVGARPARGMPVFAYGFPVIRALMRRSMRIDAAGAERSRAKVEAVFADVEARLADGRRYLVGDTFTAADLTFAALGAPSVLPPQYLSVDEGILPAPLRALRDATRARPAGAFIARMYAEERALRPGGYTVGSEAP